MNGRQENVGKSGEVTLKVLFMFKGTLASAACVMNRPGVLQSIGSNSRIKSRFFFFLQEKYSR